MENLIINFKIEVPQGIYKKDPETSTLGKKIIENSIKLINKIGFENFNFKKLGKEISSNESSIYRYFENKHKLLMYLTSWYWVWIEYQLVMETYSLKSKKEKLIKAIEVVTRTTKEDSNFSHINEVLLNQIIINENSKSYLTNNVDNENEVGFFAPFKRVVKRVSEIVLLYNNNYKFSLSLATSIIDGALHQHFFKDHFKSITDCKREESVTNFYKDLTLKTLKK